MLVLDLFQLPFRSQLLQKASLHGPGAWILWQHVEVVGEQDLAALRRMRAQYVLCQATQEEYGSA